MNLNTPFQGGLLAEDFLCESIKNLNDWQGFDNASLDALADQFKTIFDHFPVAKTPNESQTEDDLIWPVLKVLGWTASLRQQNLSARGRSDVPDGLLFANSETKDRANGLSEEWRRYELGLAIVESKRWLRPLDGRTGKWGEETAPSTQMLHYLRRVDDMTNGGLRWGMLTNGARWRLYWQGAHSVSEHFFEIDLAQVLDIPGHNNDLFALSEEERRHALRIFALIFRRNAFVPDASGYTFHRRALDESRLYQQRVAKNISEVIFSGVFQDLATAIFAAKPSAALQEVRDASLVLLYRLLFILYAEDRDLLPVRSDRYDDYSLRKKVREDVQRRRDTNDTFSTVQSNYWSVISNLCRAIDKGDPSIGLPPYNGGQFDSDHTPLLADIQLGDNVIADIIDVLSLEQTKHGRRYINYRDLSVQQLGSIYEHLLEYDIVRSGNNVVVEPNIFMRKRSGSYYTPDDLVRLIVEETVGPLVKHALNTFTAEVEKVRSGDSNLDTLKQHDPAEALLDLKVCDPAMGSGHFLVNLVDYLADSVIDALAETASVEGYTSKMNQRIDHIRHTIIANAKQGDWGVNQEQLDDRHIVRRMVLKRCVYGVDKNPMAVELAKVSLWLHTFTVGAPLSFLDHHLRCGDSLFGCWVRTSIDKVAKQSIPLFLQSPVQRASRSATPMQRIERATDADIAEAHLSAQTFKEVERGTSSLNAFLSLLHAFDWLKLDKNGKVAIRAWLTGTFGDPIAIASGEEKVTGETVDAQVFADLLIQARTLVAEERFLHWQVAFPGVWYDWESKEHQGGFDAVIGNPPWDRVKLQQVKWFAARRPEIALAQRTSDRKRMIQALEKDADPLTADFGRASERAAATLRVAKTCGDYPYLSRGDVNLYSLFVERAFSLVKPDGVVGLLTPSGIASDKTAAPFFRSIATEGRLRTLYDFENRRTHYHTKGQRAQPFFPDVDSRFKFCVFVAGHSPSEYPAKCAFFLQDVCELDEMERRFSLSAQDFARINPNTGTAPIFRSRRDAELTTSIYERLPILVDRSKTPEIKIWPGRHTTMYHMSGDSDLFYTREEMEEKEGAWPIGGNRFENKDGLWLPLYEDKMVQAFDHRAASIVANPQNLHRPNQPVTADNSQHEDPHWLPAPLYWIRVTSEQPHNDRKRRQPHPHPYIAWKMITAPTNSRTFIAACLPPSGSSHSMDVLLPEAGSEKDFRRLVPLILGNLNSIPFDFVIRQKIQGQNISWYIVEQLPVVSPTIYEQTVFGPKTAVEIIRKAVLELTYTAHDMAPFAKDLDYVDNSGTLKPPFPWNEDRRLYLRAKLDAVFFHLYGITDRDDIRYIYSTFPILERKEKAAYGNFRSRDICLAYMNALAAGKPDAEVRER